MVVKTPSVSARNFKVGTRRRGRTGRMYVVAMRNSSSGRRVRSWRQVSPTRSRSGSKSSRSSSRSRSYSRSRSASASYRYHKYNRHLRSKGRKAPKQSATLYNLGTRRRGIDGNMYKVIRAGKSRRWSKA